MQIKINNQKKAKVFEIVAQARYKKVDNIFLYIEELPREEKKLEKVIKELNKLLNFESEFGIWFINIPYCLLDQNNFDHVVNSSNKTGKKINECKKCKFYDICSGFPNDFLKRNIVHIVKPIPDLPREIAIEIESRCNFQCSFCYNNNSFAKKERNKIKNLESKLVYKLLKDLKKSGVLTVRFTGGEPLLRSDIFDILKFAKKLGLYVILNTNAYLINKENILQIKKSVDNVLISLESCNNKNETLVTGVKNSFSKKIKAIKLLKKEKIPVVRVGTVATEKALDDFEKIFNLVNSLPVDVWELYRPISSVKKENHWSRQSAYELIKNIVKYRKRTEMYITIANTIPFCVVVNQNNVNSITANGALFEDGHSRMILDPRGFFKPHYFLEKNIGSINNLLGAWNHPFMKKMRSLKYLPQECNECKFRFKCLGGSRFEAKLHSKKINAPDPLANYRNIR